MNVKRIAIIRLFILVLPLIILLDCGKAEREKKEPLTAGKTVKEESIKISEEKAERQKSVVKKKPQKKELVQKSDFFAGGFKTIRRVKYGIYIVKTGDNVWVIARRYADYLFGKGNFGKKDVGNIAVSINKINFNNMFSGVNDNLKIGDRILIKPYKK